MAARGQSVTVNYVAWHTANNAGATGDVGNHTLRWVADGSSAAPANSPAEVDATNAPGVYKLILTAAEMTCSVGTLAGKSSTSDVVIIPVTIAPSEVSVVAGPLVSSRDPGNRIAAPVPLEMFQAESKTFALTVLDDNDEPVDLSGLTLRFLVEDSNDPPAAKFKIEGGGITLSGDNNEVASVTVGAAESATASTEYHWRLWDLTNDAVLLHGSFKIRASQKDTV